MRRIGLHTSIAGGLHRSLERARELGCSTVQIFSHNPRGWMIRDRNEDEFAAFRRLRREYDLSPVFIHSSYLINLASRGKDLIEKSTNMVVAEMAIADAMGADYVVLHTGSASGEDPVAARKRASACLTGISEKGSWRAGLLLENTAGERGDIASKIEEIGEMLEAVPGDLISGICLDTCHAFSAGYDIRSPDGAEFVVKELERYMGMNKVKLLHVNDSRGNLGSGVDRHEHIGKGKIGIEGLRHLLIGSALAGVPVILETPKKDDDDDRMNLSALRKLIKT